MKSAAPWLLGLVILACGVWLFTWYRSQPEPGEPEQHMAPIACEACGKAYAMMIGREPVTCPNCKQKKAWRAQQCRKCNTVFPIVKRGGEGADRTGLKCPKCGGTRFGEVEPNAVQQAP